MVKPGARPWIRLSATALAILVWGGGVPAIAAVQSPAAGAVVETVTPGSAGARAGILPNDIIERWMADGEGSTPIRSAFDFIEVEIEQLPRRAVTLSGRRGDAAIQWRISAGDVLGLTVRPALAADVLAFHDAGRTFTAAADAKAAEAHWGGTAQYAERANDALAAAWLFDRAAVALSDLRAWPAADALYEQSRVRAAPLGRPAVLAQLFRQQGRSYERRNDWPLATQAYEQALALDTKVSERSMACAGDLEAIGLVALKRGDLAAAEPLFRRALAMRETLAPNSAQFANSLSLVSMVLSERGDAAAAETYRKRALDVFERAAPNSLLLANAVHNEGVVAYDRGDLATADKYYRRALEIREAVAPDSLHVANSLNSLGLVARDRGDFDAAEALGRRTLAIRERELPDSLDVAGAFDNLGILMRRRGNPRAAEEFYRRSLAIKERLAPGSLDLAGTLNNIANVYFDRGHFAEAESAHRHALAIREKFAANSLLVGLSLNNLGNVALQRRDLRLARDYYQRSLAIKEKAAPNSITVVVTLNNLGSVELGVGSFQAAADYHRRALAILDKVAPSNPDRINTLCLLGAAELKLKDFASARGHLAAAVEMGNRLAPTSNWTAQSLALNGHALRALGDLNGARDLATRAVAVAELVAPDSVLHAETVVELGHIERAAGRREAALAAYTRAVEAFERQTARLGGARDVRASFRVIGAEYYRAAVDEAMALNRPALAFNLQERYRARSMLMMLAERDLQLGGELPADIARGLQATDAEYDRVAAALTREGASDKAAADRLAGRLRELRDAREQIVRRIRQQSPRFAALQYPEPLDLDSVRQSLEPGTALLSYWVGEERTLLFAVHGGSEGAGTNLTVIPIPIAERDLRARVKELRDAMQLRPAAPAPTRAVGGLTGPRATANLTAMSVKLYDLLVRPAEKAIGAAALRLLIVPDGPLHALPFGALQTPARGGGRSRYLIESKAIHVAASATLYNEARRMRPDTTAAGASHLVAFGDPDFGAAMRAATRGGGPVDDVATRGLALARLPMARQEVRGIAKLFGANASIYIGAEATEARAKSIPPAATHVHFASHAVLDERLPLNSALVLAPSPAGAAGQRSDNGLLQVWEIFEGKTGNLDLVTLSACDTALGEEFGGEGLLGLTRAFQYAGARSVVASLWSIPDASTSRLMVGFYRYLREGRSKDEALRAAQIDAIRSGSFAHPLHWAAFQLFGDRR